MYYLRAPDIETRQKWVDGLEVVKVSKHKKYVGLFSRGHMKGRGHNQSMSNFGLFSIFRQVKTNNIISQHFGNLVTPLSRVQMKINQMHLNP